MKYFLFAAAVLFMFSCTNETPTETAAQKIENTEMITGKLSLKEQLDAKKALFNEKADDEKRRFMPKE